MLEEEIKQNAEKYADQFVSRCFCGEWNEVILRFTAGAHSRDEEINELKNENRRLEIGMESLREKNRFWEEFAKYVSDNAIGDMHSIMESVAHNERNIFEGYVKVTKMIGINQEILIVFKDKEGNKHTATWQASDNYACWQTTGMMGDDYSGYLLFPTYDDDKYFCLYYEC